MCGQSHTPPALPLGKKSSVPTEQEAGWARDLAWKTCRSGKSLDPARNLDSITHSPIQATAYHHTNYTTTAPLLSQSSPAHMCHLYFTTVTSHLGRNGSRSNMKMYSSKWETMTKLIWTLTLQLCVLFSYKLCACHMTGCHYIQALFHSVVLHVQLLLKCAFRLPPQSRWERHCCGLLCSE